MTITDSSLEEFSSWLESFTKDRYAVMKGLKTMEIKGIVEQTGTKVVTTKFGAKNTFSIKVDGQWISAGFKDPKVNEGDEVQCEAETTTYGLQTKAVVVISRGSRGATSPTALKAPSGLSGGSYGGGKVFPIPPLHGDRSIVRQNALNRATDLFIAARAGNKGYEVDGETVKVIISLARGFEAYSAGDLDLANATKEIAEEAVAVAKATKS